MLQMTCIQLQDRKNLLSNKSSKLLNDMFTMDAMNSVQCGMQFLLEVVFVE